MERQGDNAASKTTVIAGMRDDRAVVCGGDMDAEKQDKSKLLAFEMRCYRRLMNIKWQDMRRNENIRKEIGREVTVVDITKHRKLQLFGHICRMDDTRLLKTLTFGIVEGT